MAGIGAELAGGASGVYDYLRQQIEDRIRQQMAQQQMALGVRGADRADRALDQQDELKRLQIQSTADAKAEAARGAEEGRVMRAVAMRPTGADVTQPEYQRETGYGMPSGLYTPKGIDEPQPPEGIAAPTDPKMITGRLQMMPDTVAGSPAPSQRTYRFKGTQAEADKQAELDRKTAHDQEQADNANWRASITNDLANFKMSQPPKTPDPQPQLIYDNSGKPHMIQFVGGVSKEIPLPTGTDFAGKTNPITNQIRTRSDAASRVGGHVDDVQSLVDEADKRGLLGPALGRWSEFLAGGLGSTGNPENDFLLGELRMGLGNLKSGFAMVHGGARGGGSPGMAARWDKVLNSGKMSKEELTGALTEMKKWLDSYSTTQPGGAAPASGTKPSAADLIKKYGG